MTCMIDDDIPEDRPQGRRRSPYRARSEPAPLQCWHPECLEPARLRWDDAGRVTARCDDHREDPCTGATPCP